LALLKVISRKWKAVTSLKSLICTEPRHAENCITIATFPPKVGTFLIELPLELAKTIIYRMLGNDCFLGLRQFDFDNLGVFAHSDSVNHKSFFCMSLFS